MSSLAGVYIRDLTLFNIGNEKTLKNGLLNFSKIRTMVIKVGMRSFCGCVYGDEFYSVCFVV